MRRLIEVRVRRGELAPVALEGAGKQEHWAQPEVLEANPQADAGDGPGRAVIVLEDSGPEEKRPILPFQRDVAGVRS